MESLQESMASQGNAGPCCQEYQKRRDAERAKKEEAQGAGQGQKGANSADLEGPVRRGKFLILRLVEYSTIWPG